MRIEQAVSKPGFARHETFHLRYGWLKKCYDFVKDGNSFHDESAPVKMGVGKNMAKSIRFWGLAAKIIEYDTERKKKSEFLTPTEFGNFIFDEENGLDPYLEKSDICVVIALEFVCSIPQCIPVWWILMNEFDVVPVHLMTCFDLYMHYLMIQKDLAYLTLQHLHQLLQNEYL